jgi:GH25 family lysozyme M1 (1,4-beta-N-acetylmuramidase)
MAIFFLFALLTTNAFASGAKMPDVSNSSAPSGSYTASANWSQPWKGSDTSIVLDVYEGNSINWDSLATDKKVAGIIHRSSIGTKVDSQYQARKAIALQRGYLWGAYHLGTKGNTIAQADLFLSLVQDDPNTLMALDLEDTSASNLMSVDEAVTFMNYVYEKTGRIPIVYANDSTTKALNAKLKDNPLFQQSKLWYARYRSSVTDFPVGIWQGYFLWQFSSELNCSSSGSCLYRAPGTQSDMDVNVFNGSAEELASQWNNN